jgi:AcrR family transcriptional regulator
MSPPARNAYHHGDLRQSLIDAAIALIREEGISDLSLRHVARRVGVSHNAPYRHFQDKDALLAAVAEQGFEGLGVAMETARQSASPNAAHQLAAIGIAYVHFAIAHPAHYRVMFGDYRSAQSQCKELSKAAQQAFMVLVNTLVAGQADGTFHAADPIDMARVAWSLVHGQAMLILDEKLQVESGFAFDAFLQFSSQMLLKGFSAH